MAQYRETNNALSLEDRQNTVVASLTQVNDQFTRARTERIQKEAVYNQVKSLPSAALAESIPAVTNHPTVQSLRQRLAELQRKRVQLNERYGPKNPQVIENENAIADTHEAVPGRAARGGRSRSATTTKRRSASSGGSPRPSKTRRARRWI